MDLVVEILCIVTIELLSTLAVLSNYLCAYIFSSKNFKTTIFKYLALNSIVDGTLLFSLILTPFVDSTLLSTWSKSYPLKLYQLYVIYYLGRSLELFSSIVSIKISVHRFLLIKLGYESSINKSNFKLMALLMLIVSLCVNIPTMYFYELKKMQTDQNQTHILSVYEVVYTYTKENKSSINNFFYYFLICTPNLIAVVLMLCINCVLILMIIEKFRRKNGSLIEHVNKTETEFNVRNQLIIHRRSKVVKRQTMLMVFLVIALNSLSQLSVLIMSLIKADIIMHSKTRKIFIHLIFVVSHGLSILIFYKYNKQFAICLDSLFSALRRFRKPVL